MPSGLSTRGIVAPRACAMLVALTLTGLAHHGAYADVAVETRVNVTHTDNVNLAFDTDNRVDDTIQSVSNQFFVTGGTRRTDTQLGGNLQYSRYVSGFYDDDLSGGAYFDFLGRLVPGRVEWQVTDNYGQQSVNPLELVTPENRRDVNIFRTGPRFTFPFNSRTQIDARILRSRNTVEDSNIDSDRTDTSLSLTRRNGSVWSTSIGVSKDQVDYSDVSGFNFDTVSAFLTATASGSRSTVTLSAGTNRIENSLGESDGTTYRIGFNRRMAASGTLNMNVAQSFSDAGNLFRYAQSSFIDVGSTQDIFTTPDPFESRTGFITYSRGQGFSSLAVQAFWREDEYQTQSQFNRDEFGIRVMMRRNLGPNWEMGLDGGSVRRDLQGFRQEDDTHIYGAEVTRRFGRSIGLGFRIDHTLRDQDRVGLDREATRYTIFFSHRVQTAPLVQQAPAEGF